MKFPICWLVDNGSLRPEAIFSLHRVANRLSRACDLEVLPLGLLHSNKIMPTELNGSLAETVGTFLSGSRAKNERDILVLPLFLGPSLGITKWLVEKLDIWRSGHPARRYRILDCLYQEQDTRLAEALASEVEKVIQVKVLSFPHIAMVDHGTPVPEVNKVRESVGSDLYSIVGSKISAFSTCSMERREGDEYSFNEPLLEDLLMDWGKDGVIEVVVTLFFLSPGRHAGPNGDLFEICERVSRQFPNMKIFLTDPLAEHEYVFNILKDRLDEFQNSLAITKE